MYKNIDPFIVNLPTIDVHGEICDTVMYYVNGFIKDNYKLRNEKIVVVHGYSSNILKNKIHSSLKTNKLVKNYYLYNLNIGCTIIELDLKGD